MADADRRMPRELAAILAFGCAVFAGLAVFVAGILQVGVPGCIVCTTSGGVTSCNGNDLTYCNGGLPVLGATLAGLTLAAIGFGAFSSRASRRDWEGAARAPIEGKPFFTPLERRTVGLSLIFEGVAFASLGLWMAVPPVGVCSLACPAPAYSLTGIPLGLTVVGAILLVPGILLVLLSLAPRRGSMVARPEIPRSM